MFPKSTLLFVNWSLIWVPFINVHLLRLLILFFRVSQSLTFWASEARIAVHKEPSVPTFVLQINFPEFPHMYTWVPGLSSTLMYTRSRSLILPWGLCICYVKQNNFFFNFCSLIWHKLKNIAYISTAIKCILLITLSKTVFSAYQVILRKTTIFNVVCLKNLTSGKTVGDDACGEFMRLGSSIYKQCC